MRKGFTLIELLITMVLVAVLATVALTKYTTTLERGRATQAFAVLRDISEAWNAQYVLNNNQYPAANTVQWDSIRIKYFGNPNLTLNGSSTVATVSIAREKGAYILTATNRNGELAEIECTAIDAKNCLAIGTTLKAGRRDLIACC